MISLIFKDWRIAFDFDKINDTLKEVVAFTIQTAEELGISRLVITEIKRDDGGVHSVWRGIDLVPEDRNVDDMNRLRDIINDTWDYGKPGSALSVCPPLRHGTAPHIHLQVRPNYQTRRTDQD